MKRIRLTNRLLAGLLLPLLATGCHRHTGKLSTELQTRFDKEGIVHRADDVTFRRTRPAGYKDSGWDQIRASIIVTRESVFIHENSKRDLEITPRSTGFYEVRRDHDRVALHAGSGASTLVWSFYPPEDTDKWTVDIRSVIKGAKSN